MKKDNSSQNIEVEGGVVHDVIQAIIHIPGWGWIAGVVIFSLAIVLAAAIWRADVLRQVLAQPSPQPPTTLQAGAAAPTPTGAPLLTSSPLPSAAAAPTPSTSAPSVAQPVDMSFPTASPGESLIIIADFEDRSGGKYQGVDPAQYIYEQLVEQVTKDQLDLQIRRLRASVDDNTATEIGQSYGAAMILWGWYDALTITPRLERIKLVSYPGQEETYHMSLAEPDKIEFSIVTDLPIQATYLVLTTIGYQYYNTWDYDTALRYFNSAIEAVTGHPNISTNPADAYFYRGTISYVRKDYPAAEADLGQSVSLDPSDQAAHINLASSLIIQGKYNEGLEQENLALQLGGEFEVEALTGRGAVYISLGRYEESIADLDRAISLRPDYFGAFINRGIAYMESGNCDRAIADLDEAIRIDPSYADSYANRSSFASECGFPALATQDYDKYMSIPPPTVP